MNSFMPGVNLNSQEVEEGQLLDGGQKQPVNTISCGQQQFQPTKLPLDNYQHLLHHLPQHESLKLTHHVDLKIDIPLPTPQEEIIYETVSDKNCSNEDEDHHYDRKKKRIHKNQYRDESYQKKQSSNGNRDIERNQRHEREKRAQKNQEHNSYYPHENADINNNKNTTKNTAYHQMLPNNYYPPPYSYPMPMHQVHHPQMYPSYPMYPPYQCHNQPYPYQNHIMSHQMAMTQPYALHGEFPHHMNYNYPPKGLMQHPMMTNYKPERNRENGFREQYHNESPHVTPPRSLNYPNQYSPSRQIIERSQSNVLQNISPSRPNRRGIIEYLRLQLKKNLYQQVCENKCQILEALRTVLNYTAKRNQITNQRKDPIEQIHCEIKANCYKQSLSKIQFWLQQDKSEQCRSYLTNLMSTLQIDISSQIRQNKDAKKLETDSRQSQMRQLLDILVRDPRKIVF